MAHLMDSKEPDLHACEVVRTFVLDVGRAEGILQSDKEVSLRMLLSKVAAEMGGLRVRTSPAYSSGSLGAVERFHQTLQAQMRVLLLALQKIGMKLQNDSPLLPWLVRHAAWLVGRYLIHATDRRTSYSRR